MNSSHPRRAKIPILGRTKRGGAQAARSMPSRFLGGLFQVGARLALEVLFQVGAKTAPCFPVPRKQGLLCLVGQAPRPTLEVLFPVGSKPTSGRSKVRGTPLGAVQEIRQVWGPKGWIPDKAGGSQTSALGPWFLADRQSGAEGRPQGLLVLHLVFVELVPQGADADAQDLGGFGFVLFGLLQGF